MACGTCGKIIHGAAGLTKAALGFDQAPTEVVEFRRDICRACEHAKKNPLFRERVTESGKACGGLTSMSQCAKCLCLIKSKTEVASEECPLKKWTAVKPI